MQHSRAHPATSSGSFLETPTRLDLSDNVFLETPKLADLNGRSFETPRMKRPSGSDMIDLDQNSPLDQSMDLFEESPQTQVRRHCEENNLKMVKITTAASNAAKRKKINPDEVKDSMYLSALHMKKKREEREKAAGSSKTLIREDYDGLGGTAKFIQPLGPPKFNVKKTVAKAPKKNKFIMKPTNPSLPTLAKFDFIDLSSP